MASHIEDEVEIHPVYETPSSLFNEGLRLENLGQYEEAIGYYERSIRVGPRHAPSYQGLGDSLTRLRKLNEAESAYRRCIAISPYGAALFNFGLLLNMQKRWEEAEPLFRLAAESVTEPELVADALSSLGYTLAEMGRLEEAIEALTESLRLGGDNVQTLFNLGTTLKEAGRPEEAVAAYLSALRNNPHQPDVLYNLGNAYRALNRKAEAANVYRDALRLKPGHGEAKNNLALTLSELKRRD